MLAPRSCLSFLRLALAQLALAPLWRCIGCTWLPRVDRHNVLPQLSALRGLPAICGLRFRETSELSALELFSTRTACWAAEAAAPTLDISPGRFHIAFLAHLSPESVAGAEAPGLRQSLWGRHSRWGRQSLRGRRSP